MPDPQALLEHLDWVRRLARSLVADPNAADDLVQDTWIAFKQHPPRTTHLRAWLAQVTRNAARQLRRREARRSSQEPKAARAEEVPSSLELLAKVSTQRRVVELVLGLDEPYCQTVLLRYFEDLSPATIAERTGVSLPAVRTRLRRALEILRERLDRAHGGDGRSWLAALVPLVPKSTGISSAATGALVMSTKTIVVTAASLALLATGIWTWGATGNASGGPLEAATTPATDVQVAELAESPDEMAIAPSPREAQPAGTQPATAAPSTESATSRAPSEPAGERTRVRVHVVTPDGQPFELALEPAAFEDQDWSPYVLVTHEPTKGPALPNFPPEVFAALGTFTPRPARSALPPSCIGELVLATSPPAFVTLVLYREWLGCAALATMQEDVQFVLDPELFAKDRSGLRVRVIDRASKLPVSGARVGVSVGASGRGKAKQRDTRSDGSASFQPWPAGPCTVRVEKQGYAQVTRDVLLARGEVTDLGDVEIEVGTPIRVRVKTDLPPEQYSVTVHRAEELRSHATTFMIGGSLYPTADGGCDLYPGEGETVLSAMTNTTANTPMYSKSVIVTPAQSGTTVELELHELEPVVLHTGWVGEGRTIEIRDALDLPMWRPWPFETSPIQLQLVPGKYSVIFAGGAGPPAGREIQVGNTPTEITLD